MHSQNGPTRGLLGHWPGTRSPTGTVWDRQPAGHHGNYGIDARWIWFTNPRAVRHVDRHDRTYLAYLGGPTGRDIMIGAFDHADHSFRRTVIDADFSADDHTNPAVHVRPDGHLLVFWAGHNGEKILQVRSTEPEEIRSFTACDRLDQESATYPNPVRDPAGEGLYLFYRDRLYTADTTDDQWGYMGDGNVYYRRSTDGGRTWSEQTRLVTPPDGHYSMYFVPARGQERIHFFFTDAERGGDAPKWNVMYAAFQEDGLFGPAGRRLLGPDELPAKKADLDVVYDSHADGNDHAWIWDAAVDEAGHPVAAYATFPSTLAHEYRYARWDGDRWRDTAITGGGRYIAQRPIELHYSGGVSIDRTHPNVVYASVADADGARIRRYETQTDGETWSEQPISSTERGWDIRPVVPHNAAADLPVLWLTGGYKHMDTSQTVLRGLPRSRSGAILEGDGEHGVDLGFDLYGASAFSNGLTIAAWIEPAAPADPGIVANFGGAIKLGTGVGDEAGVGVALVGRDSKSTLSTAVPAAERTHVAGRWDGEAVELVVDGDVVGSADWSGPIALETPFGSWTLLKDEYLLDRGYQGAAGDVRLYDRPLTDGEIDRLVPGMD